jgi:hypothetical protein
MAVAGKIAIISRKLAFESTIIGYAMGIYANMMVRAV